jgi:hypothetical protein
MNVNFDFILLFEIIRNFIDFLWVANTGKYFHLIFRIANKHWKMSPNESAFPRMFCRK